MPTTSSGTPSTTGRSSIGWHLYAPASGSCRRRNAGPPAPRTSTRYNDVDHVMTYFFSDSRGRDDFVALSTALRGAGRTPYTLPMVERAAYTINHLQVAPETKIGADVLPWWPAPRRVPSYRTRRSSRSRATRGAGRSGNLVGGGDERRPSLLRGRQLGHPDHLLPPGPRPGQHRGGRPRSCSTSDGGGQGSNRCWPLRSTPSSRGSGIAYLP